MSIRTLFAVAGAAALIATGAVAQQSSQRIAVHTDWSVFSDGDPLRCWAVTGPKESVATNSSGNRVSVRRGDIRLFVSFRPSESVNGEVSFTGGYPFANDSTVTVEIGEDRFQLSSDPDNREWVWPDNADDDARLIAAMKAGTLAFVTGRSSRGNTTRDTISLLGFTAAVEAAESACSG